MCRYGFNSCGHVDAAVRLKLWESKSMNISAVTINLHAGANENLSFSALQFIASEKLCNCDLSLLLAGDFQGTKFLQISWLILSS